MLAWSIYLYDAVRNEVVDQRPGQAVIVIAEYLVRFGVAVIREIQRRRPYHLQAQASCKPQRAEVSIGAANGLPLQENRVGTTVTNGRAEMHGSIGLAVQEHDAQVQQIGQGRHDHRGGAEVHLIEVTRRAGSQQSAPVHQVLHVPAERCAGIDACVGQQPLQPLHAIAAMHDELMQAVEQADVALATRHADTEPPVDIRLA